MTTTIVCLVCRTEHAKDQLCTPITTPAAWKGRYVPGEGPTPCRIAFVGEAPGFEEDREGRPFCGPSGAILDTHLLRLGLPRHHVYVTNIYKHRPSLDNDDPTPEQIAEGLTTLKPELGQINPDILVCLGRIAASAILGDKFKDMDMMHGIPIRSDGLLWALEGFEGDPPEWIVPCYHLAAGMHEPRMMERAVWDLEQVVKLYNGWRPEVDQAPPASYGDGYGFGPSSKTFLIRRAAIDTEGVPSKPTHLSWSTSHNTGRVLLADDVLNGSVQVAGEAEIDLFNALWDLRVLDALKIDLIRLRAKIHDPMYDAYVLQDEPQALKNLVYKYRGKVREEYSEIVDRFYIPALRDWFLKSYIELATSLTSYVSNRKANFEAQAKQQVEEQINFAHAPISPEQSRRKRAPKPKKWTKSLESQAIKELLLAWGGLGEAFSHLTRVCQDIKKEKSTNLAKRLKSMGDLVIFLPTQPPPYDLSVVPEKEMVDYTCADSDDTVYVGAILRERVKAEGLQYVSDLGHAVLPMLHSFHKNGLPVDLEAASQLSVELEVERLIAHEEMKHISGRGDLNPGSGDQVAEVLQDLLFRAGIYDRQKKTKSGARITTDEKALFMIGRDLKIKTGHRQLSGPETNLNKFLGAVKRYRTADKNKGTFVDPTIERIHASGTKSGIGRLYFTVNNTRVYSGRLSGDVFMWPRDSRIRKMFKCREGHKIVTVDLSQIEPRTMAHLSGDPELCRIYREGRDLYAESASQILNRPVAEVSKGTPVRQAFKTIDLSMLYLISSPTLHGNLLMDEIELYTLEDVANIRDTWLNQTFRGIMPYYERIWREVLKDGYVRDMWNRRRRLPNMYLNPFQYDGWVAKKLEQLLEEAKRQAGNHTVQGGAQGLMLRDMSWTWDRVIVPLQKMDVFVEPLLQVHDELVLEVEDDWAEIVMLKVKEQMELDSEWFRVPIVAEGGIGQSWGEAK
jgi:uracil-DNA glycosylase family 4